MLSAFFFTVSVLKFVSGSNTDEPDFGGTVHMYDNEQSTVFD